VNRLTECPICGESWGYDSGRAAHKLHCKQRDEDAEVGRLVRLLTEKIGYACIWTSGWSKVPLKQGSLLAALQDAARAVGVNTDSE
jgi:hypothetical protein